MSNYVYIKSEPALYTVGFYAPNGEWIPESDHITADAAEKHVQLLNGGTPAPAPALSRNLIDYPGQMTDAFLLSLNERIAELQAQRDRKAGIARDELNGQIGLIQAIKHDFERISNDTAK